ncbi:hypothetical protein ACRPHP_07180 [Pantoea allii]|uniref:hypothetical protein n=1 Tax=Pantoea allii TaxID=574096 RepID=UPI003D7B828D
MAVKGDKYYENAIKRAAMQIKRSHIFDCQVSSNGKTFGITLYDDYYEAGAGNIADAADLALATLHEIHKVYGKYLAMYKTQADVSTETLSGVMSIRMIEK